MCVFYLIGLFNSLVLETLHEAAHIWAPETHYHGFASDHETIDYSSLDAMAGHSHEALEALKELLVANQPDKQESKGDFSLKLDKHFFEDAQRTLKLHSWTVNRGHWAYIDLTSLWSQGITTPPPQYG
ncbi:hypothetical protein AB9K32_07625 [Allomuricauda sp. XS_ASV26]